MIDLKGKASLSMAKGEATTEFSRVFRPTPSGRIYFIMRGVGGFVQGDTVVIESGPEGEDYAVRVAPNPSNHKVTVEVTTASGRSALAVWAYGDHTVTLLEDINQGVVVSYVRVAWERGKGDEEGEAS